MSHACESPSYLNIALSLTKQPMENIIEKRIQKIADIGITAPIIPIDNRNLMSIVQTYIVKNRVLV